MSMKIKVDKLKNVDGDVHTFRFVLSQKELADAGSLKLAGGDLLFMGTAKNEDRVIRVDGSIHCHLQGVCDRCGIAVAVPMDVEFHESFTNLSEKSGESEGEDEDVHFFSGDEIDLFPYAEQAIFLTMPMKTLCKEDCRGLCPQCGTNLNEKECSCDRSPIDPRLAVLADLIK